MKTIFRDYRPYNSDLLQEEMVAVFGDRFSSINSGSYGANGEMGFMFVVTDDFSADDETVLDAVLNTHDETQKSQIQLHQEHVNRAATWLIEAFDVQNIKDAYRRDDMDEVIVQIIAFVEAAHIVMKG